MRIRNDEKVQLVKQKAIEMAAAEGLEGFSVNKLAKACGISVATLYIYYKDKEDLITRIAIEEGQRMSDITLKDLDPELPFADGLRIQWRNRAKYMMENPVSMRFLDQLRSSSYHDKFMGSVMADMKAVLSKFTHNAVKRGEISQMPLEVYWSVAFAPLYSLLRFHHDGHSIGGHKFVLTETILWQTFDIVLKALML
jgi:TetR/AcrR family transcriptional repressor of multidrug resistance operon